MGVAWGFGTSAVYLTLILLVLEVSLSFDNAVVNARVLENLSEKWQRFFLTWGLVFPVFVVRFIGPLAIVSLSSGVPMGQVLDLSLNNQQEYGRLLEDAHPKILAFGGMFLLMVFLEFFLDQAKTIHWLRRIEQQFVRMGKFDSMQIAIALTALLGVAASCEENIRASVMVSGTIGLVLNVVFGSVASYFSEENHEGAAPSGTKAAIAAILYLEVLDASFSLDGTVGAFAITQNAWIILTGLGLGALFIRSMTVMMVRERMLESLIYLEHGAHYAIGALGILMLVSINVHMSELITGTIGLVLIGASLWDSWRHRRRSHA